MSDVVQAAGVDPGEPAKGEAPEEGGKGRKKKPKKKAGVLFCSHAEDSEAKTLPQLPTLESVDWLCWSVVCTQRLGRHAVANRYIAAGELVLQERAVAVVLRETYAKGVCSGCLTDLSEHPAKGIVASGHKLYCDARCQQRHGTYDSRTEALHAIIPAVAQARDCDADLLRFVVDLSARRNPAAPGDAAASEAAAEAAVAAAGSSPAPHANSNGSTAADEVAPASASDDSRPGPPAAAANGSAPTDGIVRCTLDDVDLLLSHWDKMPDGFKAAVSVACRDLVEAEGRAGLLGGVEALQQLAARVNGNAHGLGADGPLNTDVALGMFPALSMLNHSCRPTCCFSAAEGGEVMQVRAVQDIKAGEQLTVHYVNLFEPRHIRRQELAATKYFTCACPRCSQPLDESPDRFQEAVQCTLPGCEGLLLAQYDLASEPPEGAAWRCTACGTSVPAVSPADQAGPQRLTDAAQLAWKHAMVIRQTQGHQKGREAFEEVLRRFCGSPGLLHPWNSIAFDCLMPLFNVCRAVGDEAAAIRYIITLLTIMDAVLGIPSIEQGNLLAALGKLCANRAASPNVPAPMRKRARKQAKDALSACLAMRKTCLGEQAAAFHEVTTALRKL